MSYQRRQEVLEMPNLIEVQKASYEWFVEKGLREIFDDISPVEDFSDKLSLEFVDYELCRDETRKCKRRMTGLPGPQDFSGRPPGVINNTCSLYLSTCSATISTLTLGWD